MRQHLKQGKKIETLQNNVALCGQLYVSVQNRDGDLAELFAHEIQSFLPSRSLSQMLASFICQARSLMSDLLRCLEQPGQPEPHLTHNCNVMMVPLSANK